MPVIKQHFFQNIFHVLCFRTAVRLGTEIEWLCGACIMEIPIYAVEPDRTDTLCLVVLLSDFEDGLWSATLEVLNINDDSAEFHRAGMHVPLDTSCVA